MLGLKYGHNKLIFPFHAFISHKNPDEKAESFAIKLGEHGIKIWHDTISKIPSENVQKEISDAISHSRFILLFLNSEKSISKWMKAEYKSGLSFEKMYNFQRVIIVTDSEKEVIPKELQNNTIIRNWRNKQEFNKLLKLLEEKKPLFIFCCATFIKKI
jgi:TIR domain